MSGLARAAEVTKEYQIKAAFSYNFTKFVEWPTHCFSRPDDPIVIAVLGPPALRAALEEIVRDRTVNGRRIVVRSVAGAEEAKAAHVLFVTSTDDDHFAAVQPAIESSPVLTIGESPSFANAGGAINFVVDGDKVRFEINMAAAERAGLRIGAQLQKLAAAVRRPP